MSTLDVLCLLVGVAGFAFGLNCYTHLWRWAKWCQRVQLTVSYKGKVKLSHTIQEWMLMVNLVPKNKAGSTIYSLGGTDLTLIRGREITLRRDFRLLLRRGAMKVKGQQPAGSPTGPRVARGSWSKEGK